MPKPPCWPSENCEAWCLDDDVAEEEPAGVYLKRVELEDWACHRSFAADFDPGLNVVEGSNGVGKSTLYRAIVTALTIKADSKLSLLTDFASWHTEGCGPRINLDLVRPEGAWRLHKTYLHACKCELHGVTRLKDKVAETRLMEWVDDDRVGGRLLLGLWSEQHDSTQVIGSLNSKTATAAAMLGQVLARSGEDQAAGSFGAIKAAVTRDWGLRFTPKDQRIKTGSGLDRARAALEEARQRGAELKAKSADLEQAIADLAACEAGLRRATETRVATEKEHEDLDRRKDARRDLQAERDRAQARCKEAETECQARQKEEKDLVDAIDAENKARDAHDKAQSIAREKAEIREAARSAAEAAKARVNAIESPATELASLADQLARLDTAAAEAKRRRIAFETSERCLDAAIRAEASAREVLNAAENAYRKTRSQVRRRAVLDAEQALELAAKALEEAESDVRRKDRTRLKERIEKVKALDACRERLADSIGGMAVPTDQDITEVRAFDNEIEALDARLAADSIALEFTPEKPTRLEVDGDQGGEPRTIDAEPGETVRIEAVSRLMVRIPGVGRIELTRAADEPAKAVARRDELRMKRRDRLRALQSNDLDTLERRKKAAHQLQDIDQNRTTLLGDDSPENLSEHLSQLDDWFASRGLDPEQATAAATARTTRARKTTDIDALRVKHSKAMTTRDTAVAALAAVAGTNHASDEGEIDLSMSFDELKAAEDAALGVVNAATAAMENACKAVTSAEATVGSARREMDRAARELDETAGGPEAEARDELTQKAEGFMSQLVPLGFENNPVAVVRGALVKFRQEARLDLEAKDKTAREREDESVKAQSAAAAAETESRLKTESARDLRARFTDPATCRHRLDSSRSNLAVLVAERKKLDELLGDDPADALKNAAERLRTQRAEEDEWTRRKHELVGKLDSNDFARLDTSRAEVQERITRAEAEERLCRTDAAAWALLRALIDEEERTHALQVSARLAALASPTIARLTRNMVGGLELDERSLVPCQASPGGDGLKVRIDLFSRGTREQVALACRLEVARLLASEGRPMLLLDDPLAHTDPTRHREALALLREMAAVAQVIVFTCHADRYASLHGDGPVGRIVLGEPGTR
jgi:hypothetical protein